MDLLLILGVIAIAAMVVVMVGFGRLAWRIWRGEEMEPGGSYSRQTLGRYKDQKPEEEKPE